MSDRWSLNGYPSYWWRILQHHDLQGRNLAEEKIEEEAYQPYTAGQLQAAFQKYYAPTRQFTVTAIPTGAKTGEGDQGK